MKENNYLLLLMSRKMGLHVLVKLLNEEPHTLLRV